MTRLLSQKGSSTSSVDRFIPVQEVVSCDSLLDNAQSFVRDLVALNRLIQELDSLVVRTAGVAVVFILDEITKRYSGRL
jgi:hypothetical protein